jgi:hypothetical protein
MNRRSGGFRRRALLSAILLLGAAPAVGAAQSLFSVGGLGAPVEAGDARIRALGGVGIGLPGAGLSLKDPAHAAGLLLPTVTATMQTVSAEGSRSGVAVGLDATRFPHLGLAYPVGERGMALFQYGSFLDQRWSVERRLNLDFEGGPVQVTDTFRSDGGVSSLLVGGAYGVAPWLSVGVTAGLHTGSLRRTFIREFNQDQIGAPVEPFVSTGGWDVSGPVAVLGVKLSPLPLLQASASVTWSGALEARAEEGDEEAEDREFTLPLEIRAGVSTVLTPALSASLGLSWADWSDTGDDPTPGGAWSALSVGGGVEWTGGSFLGRTSPVRLGFRRAEFPFEVDGERPVESSFAVGSGLVLAEVEGVPLAGLDLSVERGSRTAADLSEDFWRTTLTLRLSGR